MSIETKLGIDPIEKKDCKNKDDIIFNDLHINDVKDDYVDTRKSLKKAIEQANTMTEKILKSIDGDSFDEEDEDKYLVKKAEAFAKVVKCISDLNKDLMEIHSKYINLSSQEESEEDKENNKSVTASDIKSKMSRDRKLFE